MGFFNRRKDDGGLKHAASTELKAGTTAHARGELDIAEAKFRTAIDLARNVGTIADGIRCGALSSLSTIHTARREFEEAQGLLDEAIEIVVANNWNGKLRHVGLLTNTAVLRWHMGQRKESLEILKFAFNEFSPKAQSESDHKTLAGLMKNIVAYYAEDCDFESADQWSSAAVNHCQSRGVELPMEWAEMIGRRCQLFRIGKLPNVTLIDLDVLAKNFEGRFGIDHADTGTVWSLVSRAHTAGGDAKGAQELLRRVIESRALPDSPKSWMVKGSLLSNLGLAELEIKEFSAAEKNLRSALECCVRSGEIGRLNSIAIERDLAIALREQSCLSEAEELMIKVSLDSDKALGPNHFHTANAVKELGEIYIRAGRLDEASHHLKRSIAIFEASGVSMFPVDEKLKEARQLLASIDI